MGKTRNYYIFLIYTNYLFWIKHSTTQLGALSKRDKFYFFQILVDSGSRGYWLNELAMIIHTDVEACLRLQCADLLLTALDHCRDVIQVTDSQDRVIYENNSTEKNLGYSSSDWFEKSIWDFQTTIGLTESVLNENETTTIKGNTYTY